MLGDSIRDTQTGREYVVSWDGGKSSPSLVGTDPRYTRQRKGATDQYTQGAVVSVGLMARGTKFRASIKGQD